MFDTYKVMLRHADKNCTAENLNELALKFKDETNPREKEKIYATCFINLFPMMMKLQRTHISISNEDKVEICMEKLLTALKSFDKKNVKFSTYFHQCLSNQFSTQETKQRCKKRKVWKRMITNDLKVDNIFKTIKSNRNKEFELLQKIKDSDILTTTEKEYCSCLLAGYTSTKEISERMHLAKRIENMNMDNPLYKSTNYRLTNKVKDNVKGKILAFLKTI